VKLTMHKVAACLAVVGLMLPVVGQAEMNKKQVEGVVHDYLVQNPDVVVQSLQSWQQKQMSESVSKTQNSSIKLANEIFHQKGDPFSGNPKGKVTVVEFFDYQCPHCVDMHPVFDDLVKKNPNVRVVFKEFPIRGPASEIAAKVALAAEAQGKYMPFHAALMAEAGKAPLTEGIIYSVAEKVGLDIAKVKEAVKSAEIDKQIKATYQLAQQLQLMGTPAIFIANSNVNSKSAASSVVFVPGQVDANQLDKDIAKVSG